MHNVIHLRDAPMPICPTECSLHAPLLPLPPPPPPRPPPSFCLLPSLAIGWRFQLTHLVKCADHAHRLSTRCSSIRGSSVYMTGLDTASLGTSPGDRNTLKIRGGGGCVRTILIIIIINLYFRRVLACLWSRCPPNTYWVSTMVMIEIKILHGIYSH